MSTKIIRNYVSVNHNRDDTPQDNSHIPTLIKINVLYLFSINNCNIKLTKYLFISK